MESGAAAAAAANTSALSKVLADAEFHAERAVVARQKLAQLHSSASIVYDAQVAVQAMPGPPSKRVWIAAGDLFIRVPRPTATTMLRKQRAELSAEQKRMRKTERESTAKLASIQGVQPQKGGSGAKR